MGKIRRGNTIYLPQKPFRENEENLWKTLWEKPKYFQYTRQNSLKPSGKNKEKHHNIQLPMLVDP